MFAAAIFDVDGVLVDSPHEAAWREALNRLMAGEWQARAAGAGYRPERFTTAFYQAHMAGKARLEGAAGALAALGVADPDGALAARYAELKQERLLALAAAGAFRAFDDAVGLLLRARAAGARVGAASSSRNAGLFLSQVPVGAICAERGWAFPFVGPDTRLSQLFDADVCGRPFARGKPDPAIFLAAAAELGVPPAACVVVEDAPSGVQAARAGGMAALGVARLDDADLLRGAGAHLVVTDLDGVPWPPPIPRPEP